MKYAALGTLFLLAGMVFTFGAGMAVHDSPNWAIIACCGMTLIWCGLFLLLKDAK